FDPFASVGCPFQCNNCFPRHGRISTADGDLHQRRQRTSRPCVDPAICLLIEIANLEAGYVWYQRHPCFLSFTRIAVFTRLSQKTEVESSAFPASRLQS